MDGTNICVLKMHHLVFDEISFRRTGFKNTSKLRLDFKFRFPEQENGTFVASMRVEGTKEGEYNFSVQASGYFMLDEEVEHRDILVRKNTVAIIFPYVRSQISLITSQQEVDPVVISPMNIGQLVEDAMKESETERAGQ